VGNRSKFIAMTAAAGAAVVAVRRRARLRLAAEGIGETILPSVRTEGVAAGEAAGEGHAPGHRHLPADDPDRASWGRLRRRPRALYGHKERYPYAKS
jgi:hypothetical protein